VAPQRLAQGVQKSDLEKQQESSWLSLANLSNKNKLWQTTQFYIENLNYKWSLFLLNFDIEKQKQLLAELDINLGLAVLLGMFATLILSLSLSWLFRSRPRLTRAQRIHALINESLRPFDLTQEFTEPPNEWKKRIIRTLPELSNTIEGLFECYYREAYANQVGEGNWAMAKNLARSIKKP
jgi:hypothetical protein